jgi:hypothetical protein
MNVSRKSGVGDLTLRYGETVEEHENGEEICKMGYQRREAHVIEIIMVGQFVSDPTNQANNRRKLTVWTR